MDERSEKILDEFEDVSKNDHTRGGLTIDVQLKKDTKPIQQKEKLVQIHFQISVRHELEVLIEKGHLEKADETRELIRLTALHNYKKDKSVKTAPDSGKLNEPCKKREAAMTNLEELNSKISAEMTKSKGKNMDVKDRSGLRLWASQIIQKSLETLCFFYNWGRPLPFQQKLPRTIGHPNRLPGSH